MEQIDKSLGRHISRQTAEKMFENNRTRVEKWLMK